MNDSEKLLNDREQRVNKQNKLQEMSKESYDKYVGFIMVHEEMVALESKEPEKASDDKERNKIEEKKANIEWAQLFDNNPRNNEVNFGK